MLKRIKEKIKNAGENDKIVYKNVFGAFLVKGGALFVSLYTLPAYIRFFHNDESLGLWFTILSILNWVLNFDLGIGNGLRNHLSTSLASNDRENARRYISSAYFTIGIISLIMAVIFPFVAKNIDWNSILNIKSEIVSEKALLLSVNIVFLGVMVQFFLKLINSVLYAMQKSSLNNFLVLISNVIILLVVLLVPSKTNDYNVILMAIIHAVAVAVPLLIMTFVVFGGKNKDLIPKISYVTKQHSKSVLSLGVTFFVIQLAYMIIMSSNEFLITSFSSNSDVVSYQAYYKLFSLGSTVFALMLTPLWSIITKAKAEKKLAWVKSTYFKFIKIGLFFCIGEFALAFITKPLMIVWLGIDNLPPISIITGILFALLGSGMILSSVMSSVANGLGTLRVQLLCFLIGAVAKVPLSYILVKWLDNWTGVVLANIVAVFIYIVFQPFFFRKKLWKNLDYSNSFN